MNACLAGVLVVLSLSYAATPPAPPSAPSQQDDLESSPLLTAEHCFKTSPDRLLEELEATGWFNCESCIDGTLMLYAERVRPMVDARCAEVTPARDDINEAMIHFDRAFQTATNGNWFGHESSRHAAKVEWVLISINDRGPDSDAPKYSHDDLRSIMTIWFRAHQSIHPDEQVPEAHFQDLVDSGIARLERAEKALSPARAALLRQLMIRRVARWL